MAKPQTLALFDLTENSPPKPQTLVTREGKEVDISRDKWVVPLVTRDSSCIDFSKITNFKLRESLRQYVTDRLKRISSNAGYKAFNEVWREVLKNWSQNEEFSDESQLITLFEAAIAKTRSEHKLHVMYESVKWYIWCSENFPENGFSYAYAAELEAMVIPGNPKGEAVRMSDPEEGPFHKSLELPLIIAALKADESTIFEHVQQKAVVSLSLALGRNPANLTYLRESDLKKLTPNDAEDPCYVINMPRIKKRFLDPRDDLVEEYLDPYFGGVIEALIDENKSIKLKHDGKDYCRPEDRPLFIKVDGNSVAIDTDDTANIFNMTSGDISRALTAFVKRHKIISPITGEIMWINTRRMRYSLATGLAIEGMSRIELARILDHTDTQHVSVYYEVGGRVVEHLDKAMAKGFSKYLNLFKGKVIESDAEAINGERNDKHLFFVDEQDPENQSDIGVCGQTKVCHLDPPYSCYLCPKFQPYKHADHEYVLDSLLKSREERIIKYDNARLGVQLDEVIAAVAQVVQLCQKENQNG